MKDKIIERLLNDNHITAAEAAILGGLPDKAKRDFFTQPNFPKTKLPELKHYDEYRLDISPKVQNNGIDQ